ncbi:MAG: hypothetical protein AAB657_01325 [Patescibacteria group bacterium]
MKYIIMLVTVFLFVSSAVQAQDTSKTLAEIIYANENHQANFEKVLDQWEMEYLPEINFNKMSDTVKEVYKAYEQLFNPFQLNYNLNNVVIPGSLGFYITETGEWDYKKGATQLIIEEFRPAFLFRKSYVFDKPRVRVLYLTKKYSLLLNEFLGNESTALGTPSIMSPSQAEGQSAEREKFIKKFFPVLYGHWGKYWHLETMPTMIFIFNPTFDKMEVKTREGYGVKIINYTKNKDDVWEREKSNMESIWIE